MNTQICVRMNKDQRERIEATLKYGDTLAEFVRRAIAEKLEAIGLGAEIEHAD